MPRQTAIEWLVRSRNVEIDHLSKPEIQSIGVHILHIAIKKGFLEGFTGNLYKITQMDLPHLQGHHQDHSPMYSILGIIIQLFIR